MKTLVTHIRPHLDDICALWLLVRHLPEAKDARIEFVPTDVNGGPRRDDAETICVGVGRGKFDEHKGDLGDCATTLVYKEIVRVAPPDARQQAALKKIVDWVFSTDTGKLKGMPYQQFALPAVFDGYFDTHGRDSLAMTMFGFELLDSLLQAQRGEVEVEEAWTGRVEFMTPWGKGVGLISENRQIDGFAYAHGVPVAVIVNAARTYHTIRADANSDADLTAAHEELKRREPEASWYFHHSKKMLICGGTGGTPAPHPSKLALEELIGIIRT